jgi:hypothetical protein
MVDLQICITLKLEEGCTCSDVDLSRDHLPKSPKVLGGSGSYSSIIFKITLLSGVAPDLTTFHGSN